MFNCVEIETVRIYSSRKGSILNPEKPYMNPTTCPSIPHGIEDVLKYVCLVICAVLFTACSTDTDDLALNEEDIISESDLAQKDRKISSYKGIFASNNAEYRGTFLLEAPTKVGEISVLDPEAAGTLTLSSGEKYTAEVSALKQSENTNKSSDVLVQFDSEDFSFNFTIDENNEPVISDVIFKNQNGSIVAAEETSSNSVTPVTGTSKCTN